MFRRLLEKLPTAAYTCDPEGLITYYNLSAVDLWGRAPKLNDPEDRYCGSFQLFSAGGVPIRHDQCWMATALKTKRGYNGHEIGIRRPDGRHLTALAYANPIEDDAGQLIGAVNVLVDITERKLVEEALRQADRSKDEFLAMLAHELRNPLAPMRNAVQIMNMIDPGSEEMKWSMDVIGRQIRHMTRLIDDLLDLSRVARNKLELRLERVALPDVLIAAVETSRPLIDAAGQDLSVSLPMEDLYLNADPSRLAQAISNLLNNAAKFTGPGPGRIELEVERQGSEAVVRVRDTGIGIAAELLPRIFEMFMQGNAMKGRPQGGLGIGLALVQTLVAMHGGTIEAHSDGPGTGSQFTIRLPILIEPPQARQLVDGEPPRATDRDLLRKLLADEDRDAVAGPGVDLRMADDAKPSDRRANVDPASR